MLRAMHQGGVSRAKDHIFSLYNLKGKETKFNFLMNEDE